MNTKKLLIITSIFYSLIFNISAQNTNYVKTEKSSTESTSKDYRTAEDGINRLLSNPQFVNDVADLGTSDFSLEKLDGYLTKYVPEYSNFKINNSTLDINKIYYANAEGASTDNLANLLGNSLKLNPAQTQNLKHNLSGTNIYSPTSNLSTGLGNSMYERGKNAKVDYAVDYAVDFFQNELGDGGMNSALIDIGGGLLGNLALEMNKREQEKMAEEARQNRLFDDKEIFTGGVRREAVGNIYTGIKFVDKTAPERSDLQTHYKAKQLIPNGDGTTSLNLDYEKAIKLLNEAIGKYKNNPNRAYYLYMAYVDRASSKMQIAAYRAAIIDYYFAQKVLESILSGKLPDNSIEAIFPKGYFDVSNKSTYIKGKVQTKIGTLTKKDLVNIIQNRAFAKYRAEDYNGAISDAKLAIKTLVDNNISSTGIPNDYKDISQAITAMAQFGLGKYTDSYASFLNANLNDDMTKDSDNDGITDFADSYDMKNSQNPYAIKESGSTIFYGFPNYFPLDIEQIRGLTYYKVGKLKEAISSYENIVSSETNNYTYGTIGKQIFTKVGGNISSVYSTLGSFYYTSGDKVKAMSLMDNAIKLNPNQLEYYYKRGTYRKAANKIKESEADFAIVKNPELLKNNTTAKSLEYYATKYAQSKSSTNKEEEFKTIKEAMSDYPQLYYSWALSYLISTKNSEHAVELSKLVIKDSKEYHVLQALNYAFSANTQKEEEEIVLAFEKGAGFFTFRTQFIDFRLMQKPYYVKLLAKYMSPTNNNFVPQDFNQQQKENMKRMLDSTYLVINKQYENVKGMKGIMADTQKEQMAKSLGEYEAYLNILDSKKMLLSMSTIHSLDKIECLFILNRKEEAIKYAEKVISKGKLMKPQDESINPNSKLTNDYYFAIENISKGTL
jgi:tetratricopeptide (TPR) repeat protein